ncbi:MAG: hypothetical protein AAFR81_08615 [Chloroflexota bacterium]
MRTDLWGWFNRFAAQAIISGDPLRQQMTLLYDKGWESLRAEKHDNALDYFETALQIARQLQLPCWVLFFDYWCAETLIFYKNTYQAGLDRAVRMIAGAHKDDYVDCPVRGRAYYTLMYIYYAMDVIGYEDKIREMITFMEREIPLDDDTFQRMQYTQAALAQATEDYTTAEHIIQQYLNMTIGNAHRQSGGFNMMRLIAYARGDIAQAYEYALQSETHARYARLQNSVAIAILFRASHALRLGKEDEAHTLHQRGMTHFERYHLRPLPAYYDAICEYHELAGNLPKARFLRQEQRRAMETIGSPHYIAHAHLAYARLLGRLGEDTSDALQTTRQKADALLKPAHFLGKVDAVEGGNYYRYAWQADNDTSI